MATEGPAKPTTPTPPTPIASGLKLLVAGVGLRRFSPNLFGVETPLLVGSVWNAAFVVGVLVAMLLPLLDFFAGSRGRPRSMHSSAVEWLNRAKTYENDAGRIESRLTVVIACLTSAVGEEAIFRYALPTLVPPLGALNAYLPRPLPLGHVVSAFAFAWYKSDQAKANARDDSPALTAYALAGACFAFAALEAGVAAAVALSFLTNVGMASLYLHAKKREAGKKASAGGSGSPAPRKKKK